MTLSDFANSLPFSTLIDADFAWLFFLLLCMTGITVVVEFVVCRRKGRGKGK